MHGRAWRLVATTLFMSGGFLAMGDQQVTGRGVRGPQDMLGSWPTVASIGVLTSAGPAFVTLLAEPVYLLAVRGGGAPGHHAARRAGGRVVDPAHGQLAVHLLGLRHHGSGGPPGGGGGAPGGSRARGEGSGVWLGALVGVVLALVLAGSSPRWAQRGRWSPGTLAVAARQALSACHFLLVVLAGTGYLHGVQDTRTPLVVAVFTATLNLVLELFLVYGLGPRHRRLGAGRHRRSPAPRSTWWWWPGAGRGRGQPRTSPRSGACS